MVDFICRRVQAMVELMDGPGSRSLQGQSVGLCPLCCDVMYVMNLVSC